MSVALAGSQVEPWCVLVSGSRDLTWDHKPLIHDALSVYAVPYSTVIHGMGEGRTRSIPGCDRVADQVAQDLDFYIVGIPALWVLRGKPAGPIRNRLLTDIWLAHHRAGYRLAMLAFSTGGPGTEGALTLAKNLSAGLPHVMIEKITITL